MLTLILVAALCTTDGEKLCTYMDVTERLKVISNESCYAAADVANSYNLSKGKEPRFACVTPQRFTELSGEKPKASGARAFL